MTFRFSRHGLSADEQRLERLFEILPGATSWAILLGMLSLALWQPLIAAVIVIAFVLYWLFRLFYMTFFLVLSYLRLSIERHTDWMARVRELDERQRTLGPLRAQPPMAEMRQRLSRWLHRRQVVLLLAREVSPPPSSEIYHLVIIPVVNESIEVLEPGIDSLARQRFPPERILVVFAVEGRAVKPIKQGIWALQRRYRARFLDVLVTAHPDGLPGEARVKGANATFAAKAAAEELRRRAIPFKRVIVSCFDADTVVGADYMGCVTYHFLLCPDRTRASFQPVPVFHNNIWEAPGLTRVLDIGSSFFQLVEATNAEQLVTFSSHSMSFNALVEVGYWPVDMISDDSAIFWKALVHYDGRYRVVPLPITLSMDAVNAGAWWKTVANVYRQKRRWAWGVENFPIVMRAFLRARTIPLGTRVRHAFKLFESHVAWATWAFLLTVISWLPAFFAGREFSSSVLYYSGPRITAVIFHLSALALLITIVLSICLLPKHPGRYKLLHRIGHACEWLGVPVVATLLSALPALEAQTRLMLGRYMEFRVTDKVRRPLVAGAGEEAIVSAGENAYDERAYELQH